VRACQPWDSLVTKQMSRSRIMKISEQELSQLGPELDQLLSPLWHERSMRGQPTDAVASARDRNTLESRLVIGFDEIDLDEMPLDWSWQRAALALAEHVVELMILELREGPQNYRH